MRLLFGPHRGVTLDRLTYKTTRSVSTHLQRSYAHHNSSAPLSKQRYSLAVGAHRRLCSTGTQKVPKREETATSLLDRIPWGLIFSLSVFGTLGGWFYRGYQNGKLHDKLESKVKAEIALAPEEVEEIRTSNNLLLAHFDALVVRIRARYPDRRAEPREFFEFCSKALGGDFASNGLKGAHLIERLILTLVKDSEGMVKIETLIAALSMIVESSVEARVESLFKAFASLQDKTLPENRTKLSEERIVAFVDSLMNTCQLPIRVLTREFNQYPFKRYELAQPEYIAGKSVKELVAKRKKAKTLEGHELQLLEELATVQGLETEEVDKLSEEPVWNLHDFSDIVKTRALCAWGECYND